MVAHVALYHESQSTSQNTLATRMPSVQAFDTFAMTVTTRFIAVAIGKNYKIRAEKLRELEAPWLLKLGPVHAMSQR